MDRLSSMAVFVRVVELGGFAAAAGERGISPTMAGKHVRALEAHLGARLLNRTTRRQSLTEIGKAWYDRCKSLLGELAAAEESVGRLRAAPRGTLRVSAPVTFGATRLAPALGEFLRRHPDVRVDLSLSDRVVDLVDEGFEAAIRIGPLADSRMIARALDPYASMLCAAPAYLKRRGTPRTPKDLAGHDCLAFATTARRGRWRLVRDGVETSVSFTPRVLVNSGEALRRAALAGAGIVLQPEVLLAEDLVRGRLVSILPRWTAPAHDMHVVYAADRQASPKLRCFVDFVLERFRNA